MANRVICVPCPHQHRLMAPAFLVLRTNLHYHLHTTGLNRSFSSFLIFWPTFLHGIRRNRWGSFPPTPPIVGIIVYSYLISHISSIASFASPLKLPASHCFGSSLFSQRFFCLEYLFLFFLKQLCLVFNPVYVAYCCSNKFVMSHSHGHSLKESGLFVQEKVEFRFFFLDDVSILLSVSFSFFISFYCHRLSTC